MLPVKYFFKFSKPPINLWSFRSKILFQKKSNLTFVQRTFHSDEVDGGEKQSDENSEVPPGLSSRYKLLTELTSPIILDIEEERQKIDRSEQEPVYNEFEGINLERGATGVFDIEEIVSILRREKAKDIFVVKVPNEFTYVDYLVIVTARSGRHMLAMCEFIRKIFKKKMIKSDCLPNVEGKNSKSWMALDLGNIALHVFSKKDRELFDLETLWSVGKEYDSHFQAKDTLDDSIISDYASLLSSLTPDNKG